MQDPMPLIASPSAATVRVSEHLSCFCWAGFGGKGKDKDGGKDSKGGKGRKTDLAFHS